MRIKDGSAALLEEKAGLKAWRGSKARRSVFSPRWVEIPHWSQGEWQQALPVAGG